jgi:coenzyme F420-dependent glucose-6-phosphate dehydrogenase
MAKYAGREGDGLICTSGKGMDLYTGKLLPALNAGAEQEGRDATAIDKMIEIKLSWDPDPGRALENIRFWAPLSLTPEQKAGFDDPVEMEKAADALPIEQVARRWIVASRPDDAIGQIRQYTDAGFNHLVFHGPGHDQERFLRTFGEQVLPGLRDLG